MKKTYCFITLLAVICACSQSLQDDGIIPSDDGMFPFVISMAGVDNATDISPLIDAPAGKYGYIRILDGHFVNDKGRVRLNATNLTASANFPTHEQAERMAARMTRFGINCVRLHYMDCAYGPDFFPLAKEPCIFAKDGSQRNFDPEMLDRLDYMIYQFKQKGIYVDVNLYVARHEYEMKGENAVNSYVQEKEMEYATDLLTHVNPYTGLPLAKDPCVAVVELNNEDALYTSYFGGRIRKAEWPTIAQLCDSLDYASKLEFFNTLNKLESDHWDNMRNYLKTKVGVVAPITSSQVDYSIPMNFDGMDYNDMHAYWQHPSIRVQWYANNIPMVNDPDGGCLTYLASERMAGKPFTVSEYNHPYPNFYGAEGQPMLHAYGAFQGWDGVFAYSWNNRMNEEPQSQEYFFSLAARTDVLAHFIACATMFLRGDITESRDSIVPCVPRQVIQDSWVKNPTRNGDIPGLIVKFSDSTITRKSMLAHKIYVDINVPDAKAYSKEDFGTTKFSDTKEIEWNNDDPENGMFIVRTANTKLFSGFPKGRTIDLGDGVVLDIGKTKLGWATISLTSKNADGFEKGATSLLVATGYTHNKDAKFTVEKDEEGNPTTWISCRREDWGTAPMMTEGIPAKVTLPARANSTHCWALDESGERVQEVLVSADTTGKAVVEIGNQYKTIWYEIAVK